MEGVFEHRRIQHFIHDTSIIIRHDGKEHTYIVFCQNHCRLPFNTAVAGAWRGDIVVMRSGIDVDGVINMRTEDALLVDQAINEYVIFFLRSIQGYLTFFTCRFVLRVQQRSPFRFPKKLVFDI